jgi:hypothetical protein
MNRFLFITIFLQFASVNKVLSQEIARQTISSYGGGGMLNGVVVNSTAGQSYGTITKYDNQNQYRPGFQQPLLYVQVLKSVIETSVYPNPALNSFYIISSDSLENCLFKIIDVSGKIIFSKQYDVFKEEKIFCLDWPSGNYFTTILINQTEEIYTNKITIIR